MTTVNKIVLQAAAALALLSGISFASETADALTEALQTTLNTTNLDCRDIGQLRSCTVDMLSSSRRAAVEDLAAAIHSLPAGRQLRVSARVTSSRFGAGDGVVLGTRDTAGEVHSKIVATEVAVSPSILSALFGQHRVTPRRSSSFGTECKSYGSGSTYGVRCHSWGY